MSDTLANRIKFIYRGGMVDRFHCYPVVRRQNVGEHSFGVAWWAILLSGELQAETRFRIVKAALAHDLPEQDIGDVPSPTKALLGREALHTREDELLREHALKMYLLPVEQRIVSLADSFDGLMYCIRERAMGNTQVEAPAKTYIEYLARDCKGTHTAEVLEGIVYEMWCVALAGHDPFR